MRPDAWSLVLAAGAGRRLSPVTGGVPKQFWRPQGRTSLLEDTLDRLTPIVPARRTVTIVDRSHQLFVTSLANPDRLGEIVYQPEDRGTAAGVLLGLLAIAARARDPIVILTPSDHGVRRPETYREGLRSAIEALPRITAGVALLGVEAASPQPDYGWILPARFPRAEAVVDVAAFVEKPSAARAEELWGSGAVWSTMVIVGRVSALLDLYRRHLPELFAIFAPATSLAPAACRRYFDGIYPTLPLYDFSSDILSVAAGLGLVVWPASIGWSDLGTPGRLRAWSAAPSVPLLVAHSAA
ncbi:MAG TPA: sugar phosphate nucleotidyltransferase [Vicinamibacterales bacterium]|nr:sugar phosphate nucleotidyltransferase [Vicinamibacterales bacterium]